jgi:serine/threonine-protein kinase
MPEREALRAIELPATFGKYFLTEKLATGGMAEIYLGKIMGPGGFEKQLVIKQIHPRLSGQRHFVDLFVAEAKTLVTLAHGNIVPVYELGVIDDTYFIAMEYIDGPTLYRLTETLRRRDVVMEPAVAAWIAARILEGLDYAHRKGEGVIHRDLSPRNVMLSRDGEVKLVDFGIAVTLGDAGEDDAGQSAPTGSFPYMSPEQVRKEPLTGRTDLFSVGVLLWEMLVGRRLFAREDPEATLRAVVDGEIAVPSALEPGVPARLDEVVMRALERDITARWASAGDMLAALQRYLYGLDDPPGPREVAALVARYCPPETRRLPTHHDEHDVAYESTAPRSPDELRAADEAPRPGPATAIAPRPGPATAIAPRPNGKRGPRARTETFATHVALDELLVRVAPAARDSARSGDDDPVDPKNPTTPFGLPALRDDAPAPRAPRAGSERDDLTPPAAIAGTPSPVARPHGPQMPLDLLPGRGPPSAALLTLAGVAAIGLGGAAIFVFYQGRGAILRPDAGPRPDAYVYFPEDDAPPAPDAAAVVPVDAGLVPDARTGPVPADASTRPPVRLDARDAPLDAAPARGAATLTIGANPWGDVLVDGKRIGRTPIEHLSVPAGRHAIEVIFRGEDPPRSLKYSVDLADGEARDVLADFTKPN